jgi:hypothetical protein
MDQAAQRRAPAAARAGTRLARRALAAVLLALAACTQTFYKDFAVEPRDRAYAARAQFDDIKDYLLSRKLRIVTESEGFFAVDLESEGTGRSAPADELRVRLLAGRVEMTLVRRSAGADFLPGQLKAFQETFESRLRERSGRAVTIRLVDQRVRPMTNIQ